MIIKDTATLRNHLSINGSVDFDNVKSYLKKAERSFLKPVIGTKQLLKFEDDSNDGIINEGKALAQEVVANYGYYLYLPIGAVQITDNGLQVVDNEHTKTASDKQFKELQRSFLTSAHEALDELLAFMEQNADKFTEWVKSDCYSVYNELLVNSTEVFNKCYWIFNSRQTFISLRPRLRTAEDKFLRPVLGDDLLASFKVIDSKLSEKHKKTKFYLQQSMVAFTIMDVLDSGMFVLDAQGIKMRFDVLPYEKTVLKEFKSNSQFKKNKKIEGEEYLKIAIENLDKELPTTKKDYGTIIKTQGIIGV